MNAEESDMLGANHLVDALRQLAAEDPRAAREVFVRMLQERSPALDAFYEHISSPGEGRLRHLVASAVRIRPECERPIPHLVQWQRLETDEFARRAIEAALVGIDMSRYPVVAEQPATTTATLDAYRYVSGRLRHEIRNALLGPSGCLIELRLSIEDIEAPYTRGELLRQVAAVEDAFSKVGRIVEFNPDDSYFQWRAVDLTSWLKTMNGQYAERYLPLELTMHGTPVQNIIWATDYLLHQIFWNIWVNAHQAIGNECAISIQFSSNGSELRLIVTDNGSGFPVTIASEAFQNRHPARKGHSGQGLLEIHDAVTQLHGDVVLFEHSPGSFRLKMSLPVYRK